VNKKNFELWYNQALEFMEAREYEKAARALAFALAIIKDHAQAWALKGSAYFMLQNYREAAAAMERAIGAGADDFNVWFIKGYSLVAAGAYAQAIDSLDCALAHNDQDSEAWYYRAFALSCLGKNQEALRAYDHAIRKNPKDIDLLCYKGFLLCDLDRHDEATALFAKCLRKDPKHLLALINIAERHIVAGKTDKGIREARKTIRLTVDTEFILIGRWLIIAGLFLKDRPKQAQKELKILVDYVNSIKKLPRVTDWSFECMTELINRKLAPPNQKLLLSLISVLTGETSRRSLGSMCERL